jgi:hypothetical protein
VIHTLLGSAVIEERPTTVERVDAATVLGTTL